jgi:hypothetical protein
MVVNNINKLAHTWWNLAKLYKKKQTQRKGEKKEQGARIKVQASKQAQMRWATRRKGNHQEPNPPPPCEACQLKRGEVNPIKLKLRWTLPLMLAHMVGREKAKTWNIRLTKRSPKYNNYCNAPNFRSLSIDHVLQHEKTSNFIYIYIYIYIYRYYYKTHFKEWSFNKLE